MAEKNSSPMKKTCFVVGPIGQDGSEVRVHSDWLYEGIIKPAFDGFAEFEKPIRADKIAQPGMITTQVIEHLLEDDLVIADLSLENPNAFYEIGIRHMAQKPIVHMQLKGEKEPFDTSGFRAIKFARRHPNDLVDARRDLASAIKAAMTPNHRVENPVTHARGSIKLEETGTPGQKLILDELRFLRERIGALEMGRLRRASPVPLDSDEAFLVTVNDGQTFVSAEQELGWFLEREGMRWSAEVRPDGILLRVFGVKFNSQQYSAFAERLEGVAGIKSVSVPF